MEKKSIQEMTQSEAIGAYASVMSAFIIGSVALLLSVSAAIMCHHYSTDMRGWLSPIILGVLVYLFFGMAVIRRDVDRYCDELDRVHNIRETQG